MLLKLKKQRNETGQKQQQQIVYLIELKNLKINLTKCVCSISILFTFIYRARHTPGNG